MKKSVKVISILMSGFNTTASCLECNNDKLGQAGKLAQNDFWRLHPLARVI